MLGWTTTAIVAAMVAVGGSAAEPPPAETPAPDANKDIIATLNKIPGRMLEPKITIPQLFDELVKLPTGGDYSDKHLRLRDEIVAKGQEVLPLLREKAQDADWKTKIAARALTERITQPEKYAMFERSLSKHFSTLVRRPIASNDRQVSNPIVLLLDADRVRQLEKPLEGLGKEAFWFLAERTLWPVSIHDQLVPIALGLLTDPNALEPLVSLLKSTRNSKLKSSSIYALKLLSDKRAIPPLLEVAQTDDAFGVRSNAVKAVGEFGDPSAIPTLQKIAQESIYKTVQAAAKEAIEAIRQRAQKQPEATPATAPK